MVIEYSSVFLALDYWVPSGIMRARLGFTLQGIEHYIFDHGPVSIPLYMVENGSSEEAEELSTPPIMQWKEICTESLRYKRANLYFTTSENEKLYIADKIKTESWSIAGCRNTRKTLSYAGNG